MSLFRKEAVSQQSTRLAGDISLAQPLSIKTTVAIISAIALIIIIFFVNASYARKDIVRSANFKRSVWLESIIYHLENLSSEVF